MKINIKKQDTNQLTKDLMVIALVVNALALVMHLVLNIFTGQALIPANHKPIYLYPSPNYVPSRGC